MSMTEFKLAHCLESIAAGATVLETQGGYKQSMITDDQCREAVREAVAQGVEMEDIDGSWHRFFSLSEKELDQLNTLLDLANEESQIQVVIPQDGEYPRRVQTILGIQRSGNVIEIIVD